MSNSDERGWFERNRRRLLAGGALGATVALAGCSDDDGDEPSDGDPSTEGENGDSDEDETEQDLLSAFGDLSFDDGELFVDLEDDSDLDTVVIADPHGQPIESGDVSQSETTVSTDFYAVGGGLDFESYTRGTYTVLGYKPSDETDITGTETRDGLSLVAREEYEIEPEPELVDVTAADEPGDTNYVFENSGTGPLPMQYREYDSMTASFTDNWEYPELTIQPGEQVELTVTTQSGEDLEDDPETVEAENCDGETADRSIDLRWDTSTVWHFETTLSLDGDVVIDEGGFMASDTYSCSEIREA